MMQMMQQQAGGNAEDKPEGGAFNLFDEEKLRQRASELGEGVTYVSGEAISTDKQDGRKAIFAFEDIRKLKISQKPESDMGAGPGAMSEKPQGDDELIVFHFEQGDPSKLIIRHSDKKQTAELEDESGEEEAGKPQPTPEEEAMMAEQMKQMFDGMRIAIMIEVIGEIVETNASYRKDNTITLMEMDFAELMADPEKFKKFQKVNPESMEEAKELMKDLPGIKIDLNEELNISFK